MLLRYLAIALSHYIATPLTIRPIRFFGCAGNQIFSAAAGKYHHSIHNRRTINSGILRICTTFK